MKSAAREIDPLDLAQKLSSAPRLWLFLDYDGTLADFAPTPDTLTPDLGLIDLLARLAALPNVRIAVISGRKLSHIQSLLPIPGIWLAGTYGADLLTPDGQIMHCLDLPSIRPILDFLKPRWNELIAGKDGFFLEDKDWSLALHARFAAPDQAEAILAQARGLIPSPLPEFLQILEGDRFLEIAPADVDKARTVEKLLSDYPWPGANLVYAGDDDKDELAFQVIKEHGGFTIAIADRIAQSDFFLASPKQVRMLLMGLVKLKYNHLIGMQKELNMGRKILRTPARLDNLVQIRNFVENTAAQSHFQARDIQDFVQAVDEAATNIIRHGYQGEPGEIEVEAVPFENGLRFMLRDRAFAFDPTKIPQPDLSAPLDSRPLGKLGLVFIRLMVDEVSYQRLEEGVNQLSLWKKRKIEKSEEGI